MIKADYWLIMLTTATFDIFVSEKRWLEKYIYDENLFIDLCKLCLVH